MNYSHAFHAGNFADIVKHATLLAVLARLQAKGAPLNVIDTHGGRGLYDLAAPEAKRSAEAERGVQRLVAESEAPGPILALRQAILELNPSGHARFYPGSPRLVADRLGADDRLTVFELNPKEAEGLRSNLEGRPAVVVRQEDGFQGATALAVPGGHFLVLIDPPFERADDYARSAEALRRIRTACPGAVVIVWLPLKDLETFDAFLREVEGPEGLLVAEARIRPLRDPLHMNGCALVLSHAPDGLAADVEAICRWTVGVLGHGGEARVWSPSC